MSLSSHPDRCSGGDASAAVSHLNDRARLAAYSLRRATLAPSMVAGNALVIELAALLIASIAVARAPTIEPLAMIGLGYLLRLYRPRCLASLALSLPRLLAALVIVAVIAQLVLPSPVRLPGFALWLAAMAAAWVGTRVVITIVVRIAMRRGKLQRRAVLVGGGQAAAGLIRHLQQAGDQHILICGIFDDRTGDRAPPQVEGIPLLGSVNELVEFARLATIDLLIVTIPPYAEDRLLMMLKKLWVLPLDIRVSALGSKLRYHRRTYTWIGSVPCLALFDKPIDGWGAVAKRIFDLVFATLGIILFAPVMLVTALAVRLESPGPVIFRQKRYGYNNEMTEVYKFRSMYHTQSDPQAKVVVTRDDPRVTRVGRFIRKTSIDELPQLFNVLQGRLSLVGPRPHAVNAHTHNQLWEEVAEGYFARHKVKPGITGWAQINGLRGEVDTKEKLVARVEYDLHYIEHWSVLFDLYILFLTPIRILGQENAY